MDNGAHHKSILFCPPTMNELLKNEVTEVSKIESIHFPAPIPPVNLAEDWQPWTGSVLENRVKFSHSILERAWKIRTPPYDTMTVLGLQMPRVTNASNRRTMSNVLLFVAVAQSSLTPGTRLNQRKVHFKFFDPRGKGREEKEEEED